MSTNNDADRHLVIRGLRVAPAAAREKEILQGIDLDVGPGEVHAIMGPNGSGKTTLAYALMGHPAYLVTGGEVTKNPDIDPTDAIKGGVSMLDFRRRMREKLALLKMDEAFVSRYVNDGFSGGEKKRLEMLQMAMLNPQMAILDETDSGLDIDALRIVAEGVNAMLNPDLGVLLITHYQRLLNHIKPDVVHVLAQGRIVKSGGKDLALRLEDEGYGPILREAGLEVNVPDDALRLDEPAVLAH
ncbi:MAG: Fe-S cluster assembly ATPase SufC [Chloroflexi bacterium]|nr:Fe-S cluster assembly ATPase SufC [Chloroflexota bacterium]